MKTSIKKFAFPAIVSLLLLGCSMPSWVPFFGEDDDDGDEKSSSSLEISEEYYCRISDVCLKMSINDCIANSGQVVSTCSNNNTPSSSSVYQSPQGPYLALKDLTVYGFTSTAGGSFVDLDAGRVFMQADAFANASRIDIVYEGSYIYTTYGIAEERGLSLNYEWTFIIPLEGSIAQTAREVLSNNVDFYTFNSFNEMLMNYLDNANDVERISAAQNTVFAVISSEYNLFLVKVNQKNGVESIKLTFGG